MSDEPEPVVRLTFTNLFKRRLKGLAKRYRQIQPDIQPILEQLTMGNFIGDRISGTKYTVYKVRARNSDAQVGKSGGYRLIYQIESDTSAILHLIYAKTDQATIAADEIQELIESYEKEHEE